MGMWELIQDGLKLDGGGQGGERDRVRPPTRRSRQAGSVCSAEGWGGICGTHVHVLASGIFVGFVCV